ncbi:MAG: PhoH family protein [Gammaproteobacteria bacterium]|nr:PhoH family protein [Gammaproteobacteria bacterium]
MPAEAYSVNIVLEPADNPRLANLCGPLNGHLHQLEKRLGVEITNRGNAFSISGEAKATNAAVEVLKELYDSTKSQVLSSSDIHLHLQESELASIAEQKLKAAPRTVYTKRSVIKPRGANQERYVRFIEENDLVFGIGPAGTGKTYLAVACAVAALEHDRTRKLVLVRPAVEAGERLGFLPGDLAQKIDPYLRPMYDALYEMMGYERVSKLVDRNVIEIAPLAYMRGRTLNDAYIILDEAQNTTIEQMKMFLTRIGFGSKAIVTGDITQIDLPSIKESGLKHAKRILGDTEGVSFCNFDARDIVRHPLVKKIIRAYDNETE